MEDLEELVKKIEAEMPSVDFSEEFSIHKISPEYVEYMLYPNSYYRAFAVMIKMFGYKKIIEVGTQDGASAIALSKHAELVTTYDIGDLGKFINSNDKIEKIKLGNSMDCINLDYDSYDLVFIDIDHAGIVEPLIHQKLSKEYKGFVLYDDIFINDQMKSFWSSINNNKIETDWHNGVDFGLVEYI